MTLANRPAAERRPTSSFVDICKASIQLVLYASQVGTMALERIQYAKGKSDCIAKADNTFLPKEKRKKQEEK
ncbi:hypothetical protein Tco_1538840, partial [Tanacetum coccineum]